MKHPTKHYSTNQESLCFSTGFLYFSLMLDSVIGVITDSVFHVTRGKTMHQSIKARIRNQKFSQPLVAFAAVLLVFFAQPTDGSTNLSVYPHVPGLAQSSRYRFRVRELPDGPWQDPFAFFTFCKEGNLGYYSNALRNWTHTYCNFEMNAGTLVEIEITRLNGATSNPSVVPIQTAVAHPRRKVRSWRVENGKVYAVIDRPMQFAIDIDGQMDTRIAPRLLNGSMPYNGTNAMHAVTVFANPFIDKPDLNDPSVFAVEPGTIPPRTGAWTTLYFKPGVHQIWTNTVWQLDDDFHLYSNKRYYIPGDAIVHGNMNNRDSSTNATNIRIYGHGTLSGERIPHPEFAMVPQLHPDDRWRCRGIRIQGARGCRIEGLTLIDMPEHNALLETGTFYTNSNDFNYIRWTKVIGWRANSDGLSPSHGGSGYVEDCFIRAQDDGSYVGGLGIRRNVYWTDAGGCPLRTSFVTYSRTSSFPASLPQKLYIEDLDVIYARSQWACNPTNNPMIGADGGATSKAGNTGAHVVFRNIYFTDPLPLRKFIAWDTATGNQIGDIAGVTFQNIRVTAPTVSGFREIFNGRDNARFRGIIFDNVAMAGKRYTTLDEFAHNEYVSDFIFTNTGPFTITYQGGSDYHKWYMQEDWDLGFEPADNDIVKHTAVASELIVDAPAYAGSLNIAHPGTAIVTLQFSGHLHVSDQLTIGTGNQGRGVLLLSDGVLELRNNSTNALLATNGGLHITKGVLRWKGNHVARIQNLFASRNITIGTGQVGTPPPAGTIVGRSGAHILYAEYNSTTGYTTARVQSNITSGTIPILIR
jgi:hypothetical protein